MIDSLISALARIGLHPTPDEVADALWLASWLHHSPTQRHEASSPSIALAVQGSSATVGVQNSLVENPLPLPSSEGSEVLEPAEIPLYAGATEPAREEEGANYGGTPLRTPGGLALPAALEISRRLRLLRQRAASTLDFELDEVATVETIARTQMWLPEFRSRTVRAFDLALVVESSESMAIWRETTDEFRLLLERLGAFRDIRLWHLVTAEAGGMKVHSKLGAEPLHIRSVIAGGCRRIILVISDCISPAWRSNALWDSFAAWGAHHPVALLQVMPQRYWDMGGLAGAAFGEVENSEGRIAANQRLARRGSLSASDEKNVIPLPVLTFEPNHLGRWAKLATGKGEAWLPAVVFAGGDSERFQEENGWDPQVEPLERVRRFQAVASPLARRLLSLLAGVPLALPVMRLVQRALLKESRQEHLAEIFVSGLLCQDAADGGANGARLYDFIPGVRDVLLAGGDVEDIWQVQETLSNYIASHQGQPKDFGAYVGLAGESGAVALREAFASISQKVVALLGFGAPADAPARRTQERTRGPDTKADPGRRAPAPERIAEHRIAETARINSRELDLTGLGLSTLPESLFELTELQRLYIDNNRLRSVPEALGQLSALQELQLADNRLTRLPDSLGELLNLRRLNLDGNRLTQLPDCIGQLSQLRELLLDGNQLKELPESVGHLAQLRLLYAQGNHLTRLPDGVGRLAQLETLLLYHNHLRSIPESLGELRRLKVLHLDHNDLENLPEQLGELVELEDLLLYNNRLTHLPESLGKLSRLQKLYLYRNALQALPGSFGGLTDLRLLFLHDNQLGTLPESFAKLTKLVEVSLNENRFREFPTNLGQLTQLREVHFDRNQLVTLPEFIGNLTSLQELHLNENLLTSLPESIGRLTRLEKLSLDKNQLVSLPASMRTLRNLFHLFLQGNPGLGLPERILGPTWEEVRERNQSPAPPARILDYYFRGRSGASVEQFSPDTLGGSARQMNELMLVTCGPPGGGKTSLVRRLLHDTFDQTDFSPEGIRIDQWLLGAPAHHTSLNVWDFGAREIYFGTHRIFYPTRGLYLLVVDASKRSEVLTDAADWLMQIHRARNGSPVIVVFNKAGRHSSDDYSSELIAKFPYVRDFVATDCATRHGIDLLHRIITQRAEELVRERLSSPASWLMVRERLGYRHLLYLPFGRFREFCEQEGENDLGAQEQLASLLHEMGVLFRDRRDAPNHNTLVLDPNWVTQAVHQLLDTPLHPDRPGLLRRGDLPTVLFPRRYPRDQHGFLLRLMERFELCFPLPGLESGFLVPLLLPVEEPAIAAEFAPSECLCAHIEYSALHLSTLFYLLGAHFYHEDLTALWRFGFVLSRQNNHAFLKIATGEPRIIIRIKGPLDGRPVLLEEIRANLAPIMEKLPGGSATMKFVNPNQ